MHRNIRVLSDIFLVMLFVVTAVKTVVTVPGGLTKYLLILKRKYVVCLLLS